MTPGRAAPRRSIAAWAIGFAIGLPITQETQAQTRPAPAPPKGEVFSVGPLPGARSLVYVVDASASVAPVGPDLVAELRSAVRTITCPFEIIRIGRGGAEPLFGELRRPTPANRAAALWALADMRFDGGGDPRDALWTACSLDPELIYIFGGLGFDPDDFRTTLAARPGNVRVNVIGFEFANCPRFGRNRVLIETVGRGKVAVRDADRLVRLRKEGPPIPAADPPDARGFAFEYRDPAEKPVVFVVERSRRMAAVGHQAINAVIASVDSLPPDAPFNVLTFDDDEPGYLSVRLRPRVEPPEDVEALGAPLRERLVGLPAKLRFGGASDPRIALPRAADHRPARICVLCCTEMTGLQLQEIGEGFPPGVAVDVMAFAVKAPGPGGKSDDFTNWRRLAEATGGAFRLVDPATPREEAPRAAPAPLPGAQSR
jgi:hypothetical protein